MIEGVYLEYLKYLCYTSSQKMVLKIIFNLKKVTNEMLHEKDMGIGGFVI